MSSPTHHAEQQEWHTPMRAIVYHERFQNHKSYRKIEDYTKVPFSTARSWCKEYSNDSNINKRRHTHNPEYKKTRGRPLKIPDKQVRIIKLILETQDDDHPVEIKAITWEQLGYEAGLEDVSRRAIKRRISTMNYHKCIACRRG